MLTGYDKGINELAASDSQFNVNFRNTYQPIRSLRLDAGLMYTQISASNGHMGYRPGDMPAYTRL